MDHRVPLNFIASRSSILNIYWSILIASPYSFNYYRFVSFKIVTGSLLAFDAAVFRKILNCRTLRLKHPQNVITVVDFCTFCPWTRFLNSLFRLFSLIPEIDYYGLSVVFPLQKMLWKYILLRILKNSSDHNLLYNFKILRPNKFWIN